MALLLTLGIIGVTAMLYALPLTQQTDDTISNASFAALAFIVIIVSAVRAHSSGFLHRIAWTLVAVRDRDLLVRHGGDEFVAR